jgi:hypothetical protein
VSFLFYSFLLNCILFGLEVSLFFLLVVAIEDGGMHLGHPVLMLITYFEAALHAVQLGHLVRVQFPAV